MDPVDDDSLSAAVCPIVYQLDQSASSRGYRYSFFGNGFFINDQGYLLTAAHVLESFRDGGQPYILVSRLNSPPRLLKAAVIATDAEHDIAILLATPNPFASKYKVTFLSFSAEPASLGQPVVALSLYPPRQQNAPQLDKSAPSSEVFLLSHPVNLGQSGSPVFALDSRAVVGLIEGRWLRSSALSIGNSLSQPISTPGAAIPIRYAIAVLQRHSISWHGPQLQPQSPPASSLTAH